MQPFVDNGTLELESSSYPASNPAAVEAERRVLFESDSAARLASLVAGQTSLATGHEGLAVDHEGLVTGHEGLAVDHEGLTADHAGLTAGHGGLASELSEVHEDVGISEFRDHSRTRIYPRLPSETVQCTSGGGADTYGNWTVAIPVDTVLFPYHVAGVKIEVTEAADTFMLEFAKSATPAVADLLGEVRFDYDALPHRMPFTALDFKCPSVDANGGVWVRVQDTTGGQWVRLSFELTRHPPQTHESVPMWPDWPW